MRGLRTVSLLASLLLAACVRSPGPAAPRPPGPLPAALRPLLAVPPAAPDPRARDAGLRTAAWTLERLSLASPAPDAPDRRMSVDLYQPARSTRPGVILLLPSAGGSYWIEEGFARYFATRGYAALLLRREKTPDGARVIDSINTIVARSVLDTRRLLDFAESRTDLDASRIGLFGISMGGIKGSLLLAVEPRIDAAVLGLAGGDLPDILVRSTEPGISAERAAFLAATGYDAATATTALRRDIAYEPLAAAGAVTPERVLLILARFDTAVPVANGWRLWQALGEPEVLVLPTGHYSAVLALPWLRPAVLEFLATGLNDPQATGRRASPARTGPPAGNR